MQNITYQLAKFEDLNSLQFYQIGQLRQAVFIVEQNCNYLDFDGKDLQALHLCAYNSANELVAYCRLLPIGLSYAHDVSIGRVLNRKDVRGLGIGRELMRLAIVYCKEYFGNVGIRISAQDYLLKFYTELGFIATEKRYLEDSLPHTQMFLPV
jgi:ElaA protein